ncbi:MAG: hypothetical protein WD070_05810, partial [Pirellulaceae bacterium]
MIDTTLAALGPLALVALGVALLWLAARDDDVLGAGNDVVLALLRGAGWVMLLVGILVLLIFMS